MQYTYRMNILYINGHPDPKSFHAAIEKTYTEAVQAKHDLKVLSLGKESFDPVLRYGYSKRMKEDPFITKSQELILWADHIVFAFPIWWGDAPSLLRGWIERVFTPSFSYKFEGIKVTQLLKGRTSDIIITSRALLPVHWIIGNFAVLILTKNLFGLTGIRKKKVIRLGGIGLLPVTSTEKRRLQFLERVRRRATRM